MVVDIRKGDGFFKYHNTLWQRRGDVAQCVNTIGLHSHPGWHAAPSCDADVAVELNDAVAQIEAMGYKVQRDTTSYPVVRVAELTHAATCCGALTAIGTLEQCLEYTDDDGFIVRLDWTGVGGDRNTATTAPMPTPATTAPDFKVGDVVRGRVVSVGTVSRIALIEVEEKQ